MSERGDGGGALGQIPAEPVRRAFDLLPDPVLLLGEDLVIRYASGRTREVLGWDPGELAGRGLGELVAPEDVPTVLGILSTRPPLGEQALVRVRARHRDGRELRLGISAVDRREDPEVGGILATVRDITRPGMLEEEIVRARDFYLTLLDGSRTRCGGRPPRSGSTG